MAAINSCLLLKKFVNRLYNEIASIYRLEKQWLEFNTGHY